MKKIILVLFSLLLFVSCSSKDNDATKTETTIIEDELCFYNNDVDLYYENTYYYDTFNDLNLYFPLITNG